LVEQELRDLIYAGRESRHLEYKQSMSWDGDARAKITKTILAMSNLRDGGTIVLGEEQRQDDTFDPIGIDPSDAATFNSDNVLAFANEYADPYVELYLRRLELNGKTFVVIQVKEFEEIPVICKKDYGDILHRGKIYERSRRKWESSEIASQSEMRELIEMTVEKRIRYLARVGLLPAPAVSSAPADEELFEKQIEDLR